MMFILLWGDLTGGLRWYGAGGNRSDRKQSRQLANPVEDGTATRYSDSVSFKIVS